MRFSSGAFGPRSFLWLGVWLLLAGVASGAVGPAPDMDEALARADEAALVRVTALRSAWHGRSLYLTVDGDRVRFDRSEPSGRPPVRWIQPGGSGLDPNTGLRVRMVVPGLPSPRAGEEYLVLLTRRGERLTLADAMTGLLPVQRAPDGRALVQVPGALHPVPVAELLRQVRQGRRPGAPAGTAEVER